MTFLLVVALSRLYKSQSFYFMIGQAVHHQMDNFMVLSRTLVFTVEVHLWLTWHFPNHCLFHPCQL